MVIFIDEAASKEVDYLFQRHISSQTVQLGIESKRHGFRDSARPQYFTKATRFASIPTFVLCLLQDKPSGLYELGIIWGIVYPLIFSNLSNFQKVLEPVSESSARCQKPQWHQISFKIKKIGRGGPCL